MKFESLQSRRSWVLGGVGAAVLLVAIGWLLVINPRLASAGDTQSQADDNDLQNSQLIAGNHKLAESQRNMNALRTNLVRALEALPAVSDLPDFTHELTTTASATSVTLSNIGISSPTPVTNAAVAPTTPTAADGSATPATTSSATPTAPAAPSQFQISVNLTTHGPLINELEFLKALQHGPRRVLVTSTSFAGTGPKLALTTQLTIFTAPMSTDQIAQLRKLLTTG